MMDSTMAQMMAEQIPRETNLVETMAGMRAPCSVLNSALTKAPTMTLRRAHYLAQNSAQTRARYSAQSSAQTRARTTVEMMALMKVLMLDWKRRRSRELRAKHE